MNSKPRLLLNLLPAGFPSPGEDLESSPIDTNKLLVRNPVATFFMRVSGMSMKDLGIFEGDIVVVDRSIDSREGDTVVAILNGAYTLKILRTKKGGKPHLQPANSDYPDIEMQDGDELEIWGVITAVIRKIR